MLFTTPVFVVDKTRLLYNLRWYFDCLLLYPPVFFLSDLCRHNPSHPEKPPEASLQNFLKTNKELVWKLKGETQQHGFFWSSGAFVGPFDASST